MLYFIQFFWIIQKISIHLQYRKRKKKELKKKIMEKYLIKFRAIKTGEIDIIIAMGSKKDTTRYAEDIKEEY